MSLKKKIVLSFFISSFIIAILIGFEYVNFIKIKKEIKYLDMSDTIRSKSLELRRHEKNFLLRTDTDEIKYVYRYLKELKEILSQDRYFDDNRKLLVLRNKVEEYEDQFNYIEAIFWKIQKELILFKQSHLSYSIFFPLIETTFLERPFINSKLLEDVFLLSSDNPVIKDLRELNSKISALRKIGEDIIIISKELDKVAREKVYSFINLSEFAILFFFILFVLVGLATFLFVTSSVVKRLQLLIDVVEKRGKGFSAKMAVLPQRWTGNDEVGILIQKFNTMEQQLAQREKELLQSKKLAAIGTLASGVAHELNNPLNNIYTTAQRLIKKMGNECPAIIKNGLGDIFGQTMRVKSIVSDLLEFARGRDPQLKEIGLNNLLTSVYKRIGSSINTEKIKFVLNCDPNNERIKADQQQIEEVFINLFTNAIEAMSGEGILSVNVESEDDLVKIRVSDTSKGIAKDTIEKIFEPFFTTKNKGTGLGLAIVFNIIQKHYGDIQVESKEGKGSVFIITLPKRKK